MRPFEGFRDVLGHDLLGQSFHDGRLPHAGFADEHGIVLGPPGKHLDHPPDFLVPADDRIESALPGQVGQVPAELLQGLVAGLRRLARDALAPPDFFHGLHDPLASNAGFLHDAMDLPAVIQQGQEQMLHADVLVFQFLRLFQRPVHDSLKCVGGIKRRAIAGYPRQFVQDRFQPFPEPDRIRSRPFQQNGCQAFVLFEQCQRQVRGLQPVVVAAAGDFLGNLDRLHRFLRQFIRSHEVPPRLFYPDFMLLHRIPSHLNRKTCAMAVSAAMLPRCRRDARDSDLFSNIIVCSIA